jgi:ketosteroid isomerase-like protein
MLSAIILVCSFAGPRIPHLAASAVPYRAVAAVASESAVDRHVRLTVAKKELQDAIRSEQFSDAARLRDIIASLQLDEEVAILSANTKFYTSFSDCDKHAMGELWADDDSICCMHPGFPPLRGKDQVMDSWEQIFTSQEPPKVSAESLQCNIQRGGTTAVVTCIERLRNGRASAMSATNVFEKDTTGKWRMVLHQAGPIMTGD